MKKPIAVCFSDIQVEDFKKYANNHNRLEINGRVLLAVRSLCVRNGVPALFCGDFFDNPKTLGNRVLSRTIHWLNDFKRDRVKIYAIDGNHDQEEKNTLENRSVNYIDTLSSIYHNIINVGNSACVLSGRTIYGIPYMTDKREFMKKLKDIPKADILMIHTSLPGLKEPNGMELIVDYLDPEELKKEFSRFNIVLNGHIHKWQKAYSNVYTLGATHQQRSSDAGCAMGIWMLYSDFSMKFHPLEMPEFRFISEGESPDNEEDFFIEIPKGVEDETTKGIKFLPTHKPIVLAKKYLEATGIKNKKKQQVLYKYLNDARN